jgi:hypothetical protein
MAGTSPHYWKKVLERVVKESVMRLVSDIREDDRGMRACL